MSGRAQAVGAAVAMLLMLLMVVIAYRGAR